MNCVPLITIGITAYNEGEMLSECWESVMAQSDPRWEVVMILDGNADRATRDAYDRIQHQNVTKIAFDENVGPYGTRNAAIERAKTEWYFHLDGDDLLPRNSIHDVLLAIESNGKADIVLGDYLFSSGHESRIQTYRSFESETLWLGPTIPSQTPTRISVLRARGLYTRDLARGAADWDMIIGMAEMGVTCATTNTVIYHRRARSEGNVGSSRPYSEYYIAKVLTMRHKEYFHDAELVRKCLAHAAERTARKMYRQGDLAGAGQHANIAITLGLHLDVLGRIVQESRMPKVLWRIKQSIAAVPIAQHAYGFVRKIICRVAVRGHR